MEHLEYEFGPFPSAAAPASAPVLVGVVGSGNLEALFEPRPLAGIIRFVVDTPIAGFDATWRAVLADFAARPRTGDLLVTINDAGATPARLTLRPPQRRVTSPHLAAWGRPVALDDGVMTGSARIDGRPVLFAAEEPAFMGGSVGEVHGAKLTGLLLRAARDRRDAVVLLWDTGGVRLHEANAGLIAISEIQRALFQARAAGVPVIAVCAGANGCYGGLGIVARSCDHSVMTEEGRHSVSGPEVIESQQGVEEFDASH